MRRIWGVAVRLGIISVGAVTCMGCTQIQILSISPGAPGQPITVSFKVTNQSACPMPEQEALIGAVTAQDLQADPNSDPNNSFTDFLTGLFQSACSGEAVTVPSGTECHVEGASVICNFPSESGDTFAGSSFGSGTNGRVHCERQGSGTVCQFQLGDGAALQALGSTASDITGLVCAGGLGEATCLIPPLASGEMATGQASFIPPTGNYYVLAFAGPFTFPGVCTAGSDDPGAACTGSSDCPNGDCESGICTAGTNTGNGCNTDSECDNDDGGVCTACQPQLQSNDVTVFIACEAGRTGSLAPALSPWAMVLGALLLASLAYTGLRMRRARR